MLSTNTPEAKTYARILSAFPNHKQVLSHKLSEQQRRYHESIVASFPTIAVEWDMLSN